MASGGYQVQVEEMLNGAKAYHTKGTDIQQLLKEWQHVANLDPSVFGRLAVSGEMASGYEKFFSQVSKHVSKLYQELQKGAESMVKAAASYFATEQLLTAYMNFLSEVKQDNKYLNLVDSGREP